jgi:hypothetical protein
VSATTKTAEKATVYAALGAETLLLADLLSLGVPELEVAKAWAAGEIEFGHRVYCVTGPAGRDGSALVVEDGWEWSGPKTKMHKNFRDLAAEQPPAVRKYRKYKTLPPPADRPNDEPVLKPVDIPADEALSAIALHVRLTDKGLERA